MNIYNLVAVSRTWFFLQLPVIYWGSFERGKLFEGNSAHQSKEIVDVEYIRIWSFANRYHHQQTKRENIERRCNYSTVELSFSNNNIFIFEEKESFWSLMSSPEWWFIRWYSATLQELMSRSRINTFLPARMSSCCPVYFPDFLVETRAEKCQLLYYIFKSNQFHKVTFWTLDRIERQSKNDRFDTLFDWKLFNEINHFAFSKC